MKHYKAIFFDWDGTAVISRKAPVDAAVQVMAPLLEKGVRLAIISGTTYENIASGQLHTYFTPKQLGNLYLGLGRGAFDYGFDSNGQPVILKNRVPNRETLLKVHDACYAIHRHLLKEYNLPTDIVFSRPNYCKIDLMPGHDRGEQLFLQAGEATALNVLLAQHGCANGIEGLLNYAATVGGDEFPLAATTDAKYLEVGPTGKKDNVDSLAQRFLTDGLTLNQFCFWGDEFIGVTDNIFGSDSGMITGVTRNCDFFDVSDLPGTRPCGVTQLGGGVETFLHFLQEQ